MTDRRSDRRHGDGQRLRLAEELAAALGIEVVPLRFASATSSWWTAKS